jgi:hypothetical protein
VIKAYGLSQLSVFMYEFYVVLEIEGIRIPKESPKRQSSIGCRLGLNRTGCQKSDARQ